MELRSVRVARYIIHRHDHIRKCRHESSRFLCNRGSSDGGRSVVHAERTVLGIERSDAVRILATPRLGVSFCKRGYLSRIIHVRVCGATISRRLKAEKALGLS